MMTKVEDLVSSYLNINKKLDNYDQQLKLTIVEIKKALAENSITVDNLKQIFLTMIIDQNYLAETKLPLKGNLDENSPTLSNSTDVCIREIVPDLNKHKMEWIKIIKNEKYKQIRWRKIFSEFFERNDVSIGQIFIILFL